MPPPDPILKNSAFGLMTDPKISLVSNRQYERLYNQVSVLVNTKPKCSGFVPGSRTPRKPAHSSRICVYGGAGPRNKSGVTIGTGAPCAGVPQCVSRVERSAGNPLVPRPHSQPMKVKPDSSGTSPGMTTGGGRRVDRDGRRDGAASPSPSAIEGRRARRFAVGKPPRQASFGVRCRQALGSMFRACAHIPRRALFASRSTWL